jgi:hypothetical protein
MVSTLVLTWMFKVVADCYFKKHEEMYVAAKAYTSKKSYYKWFYASYLTSTV